MLKISMVMMTTALFAGALMSSPSGLATAAGGVETTVAFVKVKTIAIHPKAVPAKLASFEPTTDKRDRKPSIRRNSGRLVALDKFRSRRDA